MQAAIATLYDEAIIVKNALDNVAKERDKCRADLQEAHKRAVEVANEIDEQNPKNTFLNTGYNIWENPYFF